MCHVSPWTLCQHGKFMKQTEAYKSGLARATGFHPFSQGLLNKLYTNCWEYRMCGRVHRKDPRFPCNFALCIPNWMVNGVISSEPVGWHVEGPCSLPLNESIMIGKMCGQMKLHISCSSKILDSIRGYVVTRFLWSKPVKPAESWTLGSRQARLLDW